MCDENERNKEKNEEHVKMLLMEARKHFIGCLQKTGENDWDKLQVNDSGHNEGTINFV